MGKDRCYLFNSTWSTNPETNRENKTIKKNRDYKGLPSLLIDDSNFNQTKYINKYIESLDQQNFQKGKFNVITLFGPTGNYVYIVEVDNGNEEKANLATTIYLMSKTYFKFQKLRN
ncbi:MAG: hypothetical protein KC550_02710 [Nanoarchaeota archaeon]|nr:hypothetical protein [Nanoarchaeota archaeon]